MRMALSSPEVLLIWLSTQHYTEILAQSMLSCWRYIYTYIHTYFLFYSSCFSFIKLIVVKIICVWTPGGKVVIVVLLSLFFIFNFFASKLQICSTVPSPTALILTFFPLSSSVLFFYLPLPTPHKATPCNDQVHSSVQDFYLESTAQVTCNALAVVTVGDGSWKIAAILHPSL